MQIYNQSITIISDFSTSKLLETLLVHVHDHFPTLHQNCIHLSSLYLNSGYEILKSIKQINTSLQICDTVMIRDIKDVVHFFEKESKSFFQQIDIDYFIACDIFSGYSNFPSSNDKISSIDTSSNDTFQITDDPLSCCEWPYSVSSRNYSNCYKCIDIRSSLWKYFYYQKKKKLLGTILVRGNTTSLINLIHGERFHLIWHRCIHLIFLSHQHRHRHPLHHHPHRRYL